MSELSEDHRLAQVLLDAVSDGEVGDNPRGARAAHAGHEVLSGLHRALRSLIGSGGWQAVMGRAIVRGSETYPSLGRLDAPRGAAPEPDELARVTEGEDDASAAIRTLIAELLVFLARLVGWRLTLVVLRDLWPHAVDGFDPDALAANGRSSSQPEES